MEEVSIIVDLAKRSFQVHGAKADGSVAYRRKLGRGRLLSFLASQPPCTVAMEAYWGREITSPATGEAGPPDLRRQAPQERRSRRGGDHGSCAATDHAFRGGQVRSRCSFTHVTCCAAAHADDHALRGHLAEYGVVDRARIRQLAGRSRTGTVACRRRSSSWAGCSSGGSGSSRQDRRTRPETPEERAGARDGAADPPASGQSPHGTAGLHRWRASGAGARPGSASCLGSIPPAASRG